MTDPNSYAPAQVLVQFQPGVKPAGHLPAGTTVLDDLAIVPDLYSIRVPAGWGVPHMLNVLGQNPSVRFAQPDYLLSINQIPNDPSFGVQWGLNNTGQSGGTADADIDAPEAWDTATGSSVVVAVIDSGIDYNHPDLAANIWTNPGEIAGNGIDDDGDGFIDDVHGYDFWNSDGDPMDDNGHGTHVAGIIGAVGNNGIGVAGVAWNVKMMALKVGDASGTISDSGAIAALSFAVNHGVKLSNNSWGSTSYDQLLSDAIDNARNAGHIFVAAAGNAGTDDDTAPHYPASFSQDNIVSVAATDRYDALASFSNYGANSVDLAAPGHTIYSTLPNNSYGYKAGTSMATPHVTGALAMVWGQHPSWTYQQVINQVLSTVDPLSSLTGKVATGGRLNLARALGGSSGSGGSTPSLSIGNASVTEGNSGTTSAAFTVTLSAANAQAVTVAYATADGTATTASGDFQSASGTLTFAPGETSKTVTVLVNGDTAVESDETFTVNLSGAINATIAASTGAGTIVNDDSAPPTVTIGKSSVVEGNSGNTSATFTVSLSAASAQTVTVGYATADGTATVASGDYTAASGTVTFAPGETAKTVTVLVAGETQIENDEGFSVALSNSANASLGLFSQADGTIKNDDTLISINDVTNPLAGNGTTDFTFTITLAQASALSVTVNFATADGSLHAPAGYVATTGTLTFAAGETTKTVTVKVKKARSGDYFYLNLSSPTNAILADAQGVGTVA